MTKSSTTSQRAIINRKRVEKLLLPIATFLQAGGLPKKEAESIFSSIYGKPARLRPVRRVERIGHPTYYADIVTQWTRDKRFVDRTGRPRPLPLRGRKSFSTLVKIVNPESDINSVLSVFNRYRNIRRTKNGLYELLTPYFSTSTPKSIAYEPLAHFLSDASTTLGRVLKPANHSRKIESFWRMVDNPNLSETAARNFTIFVRERSQTFLEEVDDWLEAYGRKKSKRLGHKRRRVGLGLFSIYSDL